MSIGVKTEFTSTNKASIKPNNFKAEGTIRVFYAHSASFSEGRHSTTSGCLQKLEKN